MASTCFHNPHGLFHKDHMSTAADMILLQEAAGQHPLYLRVVATRRYKCLTVVPKKKGVPKKGRPKPRPQLWVNTNQLLWDQGLDVWEALPPPIQV
jgi:D-alanyl-D-alanine carboxypeptidase